MCALPNEFKCSHFIKTNALLSRDGQHDVKEALYEDSSSIDTSTAGIGDTGIPTNQGLQQA